MLIGIREELVYEIQNLVETYNISYIDAILSYCEKNSLDEEYIGTIISKNSSLTAKVTIEAESLNFIEKTDRLPI